MKKYIITIFVFLGLILGVNSVLAEKKESLKIEEFSASGFINASVNEVVLHGSINSTNEYQEIYWYVLNLENKKDVFFDKCNISSKKLLTSISEVTVDEDYSRDCKVKWNTNDLEDSKYQVVAKSFLNLEEELEKAKETTTVNSEEEFIKQFIIKHDGDLSASITVILDKTAPVITLNGQAEISLTRGDNYTDEGVTIKDGSLKETTGEVDTSTVGTYTITYIAKDQAGNEATAERIVHVERPTRRSSSSGSYVGLPVQNIVIPPTIGEVLGAESYFFTSLLKLGSTGAEVMELQKFLNINGYESGLADGKFGPITQASVIRFQLANGLVGDGIVGPLTRAVLNK